MATKTSSLTPHIIFDPFPDLQRALVPSGYNRSDVLVTGILFRFWHWFVTNWRAALSACHNFYRFLKPKQSGRCMRGGAANNAAASQNFQREVKVSPLNTFTISMPGLGFLQVNFNAQQLCQSLQSSDQPITMDGDQLWQRQCKIPQL